MVLVHFTRRRKDLPFSWMFWLFALFIISCGATHLMEVLTSYIPLYRLSGLVKLGTAVASLATAGLLVPLVPRALALRSPRELEQEIAQRKQAQRTLESQALLLELAHDSILVRDLADRVTFWNQRAVAQYGWSRSEAVGQVTHTLLHTEFPQPLQDIRSRLLQDGRWEGELVHTRRDGGRIVVSSRWALQRDEQGSPVGVLEINSDITARKQAELALQRANTELEQHVADRTAALRQSEEEYRQIFEMSAMGMAQVTPEGRWRRVNRRLCEMVGYSREELLERTFQDITHAEDLEPDLELTRRLLAGEIDTYALEKRYLRKDGSLLWVNITVSLVRQPSGEPHYFISVIEDISRRKELEREVRRHAGELEQRVEERTHELQEANSALEAFGFSVSHDLRTPLRNMQALAQALEEDHADQLGTGGRDFCHRISAAACKMDTLINDLLAYSRLSRGALPLERVDLNGVLAEARATLTEVIPQSEAQVRVDGPLPAVVGHWPTLVQVLTNLLANALKFVAPGVPPQVRVWAEDRGPCVRLWLEDNGIGIAPEHQPRIFDVFERLHGEESYPGTGIGLAIVRKGVERAGGRVGVESEVGRGSRFWLELQKPGEKT